jgi:hypothetical protein
MATTNFASYDNTSSAGSYADNLGRAARGFLQALLAVQPSVVPAGRRKAAVLTRGRTADIRKLYRLAADFDTVSPSLAAELRHIAGRD